MTGKPEVERTVSQTGHKSASGRLGTINGHGTFDALAATKRGAMPTSRYLSCLERLACSTLAYEIRNWEGDSMKEVPVRADGVCGCLVGLAIGDALGAPLEFMSRREVRRRYPNGLREMVSSPLWEKGEYTDDTQMALLIAESLLERQTFVASDVARRFQDWAQTAKDVGIQTRAVVNSLGYVEDPEHCSLRYYETHPASSAGNGALMRCAPVTLLCLNCLDQLVEMSRSSSRVTHHDPKAQSSCVILNVWIQAAIIRRIWDARVEAISLLNVVERPAWQRLERIESYAEDGIRSSGYTVHTLEAAVWSFLTTESYEEAVVRAVNLGDDADTVGAVCGALAGAYYGYSAIPANWRNQLREESRIRETALALASRAVAV